MEPIPVHRDRKVHWADNPVKNTAALPAQPGNFLHEFPFRSLDESEATAAKSATNNYIPEPVDRLRLRPYEATNKMDSIEVQARPEYPDNGLRVKHPSELFKDTVTLTPAHGPLAELLCAENDTFTLAGSEFWDLLNVWCKLSSKDCEDARRAKAANKPFHRNHKWFLGHRIQAVLLAVPDTDVFQQEACGQVYDLRDWWKASENGLPLPVIGPIAKGSEQRQCLNPKGLQKLSKLAPVEDEDILEMMSFGFISRI